MDEDEDEGATDKDERWVPRRYSVNEDEDEDEDDGRMGWDGTRV